MGLMIHTEPSHSLTPFTTLKTSTLRPAFRSIPVTISWSAFQAGDQVSIDLLFIDEDLRLIVAADPHHQVGLRGLAVNVSDRVRHAVFCLIPNSSLKLSLKLYCRMAFQASSDLPPRRVDRRAP